MLYRTEKDLIFIEEVTNEELVIRREFISYSDDVLKLLTGTKIKSEKTIYFIKSTNPKKIIINAIPLFQ